MVKMIQIGQELYKWYHLSSNFWRYKNPTMKSLSLERTEAPNPVGAASSLWDLGAASTSWRKNEEKKNTTAWISLGLTVSHQDHIVNIIITIVIITISSTSSILSLIVITIIIISIIIIVILIVIIIIFVRLSAGQFSGEN